LVYHLFDLSIYRFIDLFDLSLIEWSFDTNNNLLQFSFLLILFIIGIVIPYKVCIIYICNPHMNQRYMFIDYLYKYEKKRTFHKKIISNFKKKGEGTSKLSINKKVSKPLMWF
jgi:hypothetical protein